MRRYGRLSVVARALVQHAAVSLAALALVAAAASTVSVRLVQNEALRQAESNGEAIATRVVGPWITEDFYSGDAAAFKDLDDRVQIRMSDDTIQRIKVWSADGVILYCNDHQQIGLHFPLDPDDLTVLTNGGVDSDISDLDKSENLYDRGFGESLEVYAGISDTSGRPILVETYFTTDRLHADESGMIRRIIPVVLLSVLVLGLLLVPLAFSLARRVARYERERQAMIRLAVDASSAERRRVAGELHDGVIQDLAGVGYALTALDTQMAGLGGTFSTPRIDALRRTLRSAQRLVHDDVLALRELTGVQYAAESGAADPAVALRVIADDIRDEGTPVEMTVGELPALPASHRAALIRVGREALRNAAKHAHGSNVALDLGTAGDNVVVTVSDDGPGFEPGSALGPVDGHIGLALLTDAADSVGGRLDLRTRPGRGTTVKLTVPIPVGLAKGPRTPQGVG
ncbi:MAG TPA: ATP-binding protein [Mycobacteriales bacterium]|jgi:two-component system NarL family sensor kinase|nr:ATP-binding protein [Mycobacteriales bacterium]